MDTYETKEELAHADRLAVRRLIKKFETLDAEFRQHHYTIVEMLDEGAVDEEQAALDDHDERVTDLVERLQQLVSGPEESASGSPSGSAVASLPLQWQLERIEKRIRIVDETTRSVRPGPAVDQYLLSQLEEEVVALKAELADTGRAITTLETGREDLLDLEAALNKNLFNLGLQIKRLIAKLATGKSTPGVVSGVELPKIEVPTFDGNILNWGMFWEQFRTTIHSGDYLTDAAKLTYLQHALRDGTAKNAIEGLTRSAGIDCL